ncbi:hypothetical protein HispidOSU_015966, partial [Sigmodon hispidus]
SEQELNETVLGWGSSWYFDINLRGSLGDLGSHSLTGKHSPVIFTLSQETPPRTLLLWRTTPGVVAVGGWRFTDHWPLSWDRQFVFDFAEGPLQCGVAGSGRPQPAGVLRCHYRQTELEYGLQIMGLSGYPEIIT